MSSPVMNPRAHTIVTPRPRASRVASRGASRASSLAKDIGIQGVHHVAIICDNLERSMAFYGDLLGLEINPERPEDKLPYRGAWLWIGPEMIHPMELPNPDCAHAEFRPTHGAGQTLLHRCRKVGAADGGAGERGNRVHGE